MCLVLHSNMTEVPPSCRPVSTHCNTHINSQLCNYLLEDKVMKTLLTLLAVVILFFSSAVAQQNPCVLGPIDPMNDTVCRGWMTRDVDNGYMYFQMYDGNGPFWHPVWTGISCGRLWRTDGTPNGTSLYADAQVSGQVRVIDNLVYFSGVDPNGADDPWRSDGTAAGTFRLIDLGSKFAVQSELEEFTPVNGTVFMKYWYRKNFHVGGVVQLVKTDGTTGGSSVVQSGGLPGMWDLTGFGNNLLIYNRDLWISDGTEAGTVELRDICPAAPAVGCLNLPYSPWPDHYERMQTVKPFIMNGVYYARFSDGVNGAELWRSDGTAAGTVMVKDINPGSGTSWPIMFSEMNGELYFAAYDSESGMELWKSDGSATGTTLVKNINPNGNSEPLWLTAVTTAAGERLFFSADDGLNGRELWISDGTSLGTLMVKDINMNGSSNPRYDTLAGFEHRSSDEGYCLTMGSLNGILYFPADDGSGYELWRSDGTNPGTYKVIELNPGGESRPRFVTEVNGKVLFFAYEPTYGYEWWSYDPALPINYNIPPVAAASGAPTQGVAPLQVLFSSAGSYDPDGITLTYAWDFGDGIGYSTAPNPTYTYSVADMYTAELTVTDADNATATASVTITATSSAVSYIHVESQTVTSVVGGGNKVTGQDVVLIHDGSDQPVAGAVVFATYSGPTSGTVSGTTGANGTLTLVSSWIRNPSGIWCFTVTDVQASGYTYDDNAGSPGETCEPIPKRSSILPATCVLEQNYPNPFNPTTTIRFSLPDEMHARLKLFDLDGREVMLAQDGLLEAGSHSILLDCSQLPSGTYWYRLETGEGVLCKSMILMK